MGHPIQQPISTAPCTHSPPMKYPPAGAQPISPQLVLVEKLASKAKFLKAPRGCWRHPLQVGGPPIGPKVWGQKNPMIRFAAQK